MGQRVGNITIIERAYATSVVNTDIDRMRSSAVEMAGTAISFNVFHEPIGKIFFFISKNIFTSYKGLC